MLRFSTLVKRSLRHYARSHLGTLAGAIVASAVLVGALAVGDSVRESLRTMAKARLGIIEFALIGEDRIVRASLADALKKSTGRETAAAMILRATAKSEGGARRANHVNVLGVEEDFWKLALKPESIGPIDRGHVVLNQSLSAQLNVGVGDTLLLRISKPTALSREAPLSPEEDASVAIRLKIQSIVKDAQLGRFSLHASQIPPFNAFVHRGFLQEQIAQIGGANLLLIGEGESPMSADDLMNALREDWNLADCQLALREVNDEWELHSPRIFLDETLTDAVQKALPEAKGILTYFIHRIESGKRISPFSMVTAGSAFVPEDLAEDEIILNEWLAEDLSAKRGDRILLRYFRVGIGRTLIEETSAFKVHSIVPIEGIYADAQLMPDFPGLKDAQNCRDWDTGFPIDLDAIRDKDNAYWKAHRGTPKAFVSESAGRRMWSNRFGDLTAIRFSKTEIKTKTRDALSKHIAQIIDPTMLGLTFRSIGNEAMQSVNQSQDFGGLFIGFSCFLIFSALLLMSMLFEFSLEQRTKEAGLLLAIGFRPQSIKHLFYSEGGFLAAAGALIGALLGMLYAKAMLFGLTTIWSEAIGNASIVFHFKMDTFVGGALASMLVAWLTICLRAHKQSALPARVLLQGNEVFKNEIKRKAKGRLALAIGLFLLAITLVGMAIGKGTQNASWLFFAAGGLLLIAKLIGVSWLIEQWAHSSSSAKMSLLAMGIRGNARRIQRSVATIGLLACGSFLIVSVGANKLDANKDAQARHSGTGGFLMWGESTEAIIHNLNEKAGKEFFLLDNKVLDEVQFVPFRVLPGEDASCLNLNRAQHPRLLGVDPDQLARRNAFTFASFDSSRSVSNPWLLLNDRREDAAIPAIADQSSMLWAMGKKLGDKLQYINENGDPFEILLIGALSSSILQGNLILSEKHFVKHYPHQSGYRAFLIDGPFDKLDAVQSELSRAFEDVGMELLSAARRLADFNAVQNTYLSTFQLLGGLGLMLGSVALGVVVLRNVWERRAELALLKAMGFQPARLRQLILNEHLTLLILGLFIGIVSAILALIPVLISPSSELPFQSLITTLFAVFASGLVWTNLAARLSLKGELLKALRNE